MKLPSILNQTGISDRPEERLPYFDPKKYEQLLATAVLNKVINIIDYVSFMMIQFSFHL